MEWRNIIILSKPSLLLLFSTIFTFCLADAVACKTYFPVPTADWYSTTFEFGSTGAVIDYYGIHFFDASLCTGDSIPLTCNIFIPDGTDSVLISISQTLNVSGGEFSIMEFSIYLATVNHGSEVVWEQDINNQHPQHTQSGTLSFRPDWIEAGNYLGFVFRADVQPDDWGSTVYWEISHITV